MEPRVKNPSLIPIGGAWRKRTVCPVNSCFEYKRGRDSELILNKTELRACRLVAQLRERGFTFKVAGGGDFTPFLRTPVSLNLFIINISVWVAAKIYSFAH